MTVYTRVSSCRANITAPAVKAVCQMPCTFTRHVISCLHVSGVGQRTAHTDRSGVTITAARPLWCRLPVRCRRVHPAARYPVAYKRCATINDQVTMTKQAGNRVCYLMAACILQP